MPQRIVVAFRAALGHEPGAAADYIGRALATKKSAEARGAKLCAWGALTFSFELAPDELEEAISLAAIGLVGEPANQRFMVGVSQGELSLVGESGAFAALSWGPPLVTAVLLSREAAGGEVLLDAGLLLARSSEIAELGWFVDTVPSRGVHRLVPSSSGVYTEEAAAAAAAVAAPSARPDIAPPPEPPPVSRRGRPPPLPPRVPRPPMPSNPDDAFSHMAKRALIQGDVAALERLIAQLKEAGQSADAIERLSGFVALRRGATAEALRKLRSAAEAEQVPAQMARARLAYAVALASAGRAEAAVLEALDALARARAASDPTGETACARFLARLSAAAGHLAAAKAWAKVAAVPADPAAD